MIKKSLSSAVFFLILYQLFISTVRPKWGQPLEFAQGNRTMAQRFMYTKEKFRVVVIGSSLLFRLKKHIQTPDTAVLAFVGQGSPDGLEVVERSDKRPELLLVETNRIYRWPRRDFLDELFQPGLRELREALPVMQQEYQPASLLIPPLETGRQQLVERLAVNGKSNSPDGVGHSLINPEELLRMGINRTLDEQARSVPPPWWMLPDLRRKCDRIAQGGTQIRFFEIPEENEVMNSAKGLQMRELIRKEFSVYPDWPLPKDTAFQTVDGEHLNDESASRFAQYLVKEIDLALAR